MADDKQPNITISGSNVQGGNINFGKQEFHGAVTITMGDLSGLVNAIPTADQSDKAQLDDLLKQLQDALKAVPAENQQAAQKVADRTEELVKEAGQPEVDKDGVEAKANLLKKAAENIQGAMPVVFGISIGIVEFIRKLHGL